MRVRMVAQLDDRKGATVRIGSDDEEDDFGAGEDADCPVKSVDTKHLDHAFVADSDGESLSSSESSLEGSGRATRSVPLTEVALDSSSEDGSDGEDNADDTRTSGFCTIQNPIFDGRLRNMGSRVEVEETYLGKQKAPRSIRQLADLLLNDKCDEEGRYANDLDERSRLMAAAQAASIPSDDRFTNDSANGSRHAQSDPTMPKLSKRMSMRMLPTIAKPSRDGGSAEGSRYLSLETDIDRSCSDNESPVYNNGLNRTGICSRRIEPSRRKSWRHSIDAEDDDQDDGWSRSELSEKSSGSEGKRPVKRDLNSASFPSMSRSFKWATVKTKVFHSFRALKASAGSSTEGSRTIFVRNLAREVTEDHLNDFFQDSGSVVDIWLIRDAQSGLNSAYVEFESGNAARKAVRKSGKKLEGRVILCDIAYENSKGNHGNTVTRHGGRRGRSNLFESDTSSVSNRLVERQSALQLFHPQLQDGDAKFLSRFSQQFSFSSYSDSQTSARHAQGVTKDRDLKGRRGPALSLWPDSYEDSILMSGKIQAELEQSVYFDAQNLEGQGSLGKSLRVGRRKGRFPRFGVPWKWPRCQGWRHSAKPSPTPSRRNVIRDTRLTVIDTRLKKTRSESVKLLC